ncbi:MAG: hypothetical protein ACJAWV_000209 [Flammeovirgaceae bacterium]|jgi:hypothetical protein
MQSIENQLFTQILKGFNHVFLYTYLLKIITTWLSLVRIRTIILCKIFIKSFKKTKNKW